MRPDLFWISDPSFPLPLILPSSSQWPRASPAQRRLSRYTQVHIRLCCISWWQFHLMVLQTSSSGISLQRWSKISWCDKCCHWSHLVVSINAWALAPLLSNHIGLLQHKCCIEVFKPWPALAHQACEDWSSLCSWKNSSWRCSHSSCSDFAPVYRHLYQGVAFLSRLQEFRSSLKTLGAC